MKALYNDSRVLPLTDEAPARVFRSHVRDLHRTMNRCFKENSWNLPDINREMDKINNDIRTLAYANVAPPLIAKLRNEPGAIDRMSNRIEVIIRTDFIPAAYALAEIATVKRHPPDAVCEDGPAPGSHGYFCRHMQHARRAGVS